MELYQILIAVLFVAAFLGLSFGVKALCRRHMKQSDKRIKKEELEIVLLK